MLLTVVSVQVLTVLYIAIHVLCFLFPPTETPPHPSRCTSMSSSVHIQSPPTNKQISNGLLPDSAAVGINCLDADELGLVHDDAGGYHISNKGDVWHVPDEPEGAWLHWPTLAAYVGPGFLVCIAYLDPGNLEADLQVKQKSNGSCVTACCYIHMRGHRGKRFTGRTSSKLHEVSNTKYTHV